MNWNYIFKILGLSNTPIVFNRGIGGDTSTNLLNRFDDNVLLLKPSKIFIEIGTNDFIGLTEKNSQRKEGKLIKNYKLIIDKALASNVSKIYIISIFPVLNNKLRNSSIKKINSTLRNFCRSNPRLTFINSFDEFYNLETHQAKKKYMQGAHTAHLNIRGYIKWAELLVKHI